MEHGQYVAYIWHSMSLECQRNPYTQNSVLSNESDKQWIALFYLVLKKHAIQLVNLPRVEKACNPACKFTVMWSRISKPSNELSQWSPNHFVPCIPSSLVSPPIQQWVNVVKKRRLRCSTLKWCTEQPATQSEFTSFHRHGRSSSNFMQQHSTPTSRIQPCSMYPTKQSPTSTSRFLQQPFTPTKCLPTSTHEYRPHDIAQLPTTYTTDTA